MPPPESTRDRKKIISDKHQRYKLDMNPRYQFSRKDQCL